MSPAILDPNWKLFFQGNLVEDIQLEGRLYFVTPIFWCDMLQCSQMNGNEWRKCFHRDTEYKSHARAVMTKEVWF